MTKQELIEELEERLYGTKESLYRFSCDELSRCIEKIKQLDEKEIK
jgi:hypothetical protein